MLGSSKLQGKLAFLSLGLIVGSIATAQWQSGINEAATNSPSAPSITPFRGGSLIPAPVDGVGASEQVNVELTGQGRVTRMAKLVLPAQQIRRMKGGVGLPESDPSYMTVHIRDDRDEALPIKVDVSGSTMRGGETFSGRPMLLSLDSMQGDTDGVTTTVVNESWISVTATPEKHREFDLRFRVQVGELFGKDALSGIYAAIMEISVE